ncbi:MAG: glycosyltransferase [Patescibacteria group bacterium]|nr:glycosyltransferase [Patescibacteria group bacterium]
MSRKKIAIVYDWVDKMGGVERLLEYLFSLFPDADLLTSTHSPEARWATGKRIIPSFMHYLPQFIRKNRVLSLPFYPFAFESFDLRGYSAVISVSSSFSKGVITRPETPHVNIMLTPPRWLWDLSKEYRNSGFLNAAGAPLAAALRRWDYLAAQRPDKILAISRLVAARCRKHYGRDATVVYPPFDTKRWASLRRENFRFPKPYFLVVSRLEPYKAVEIAIQAFAKLPERHLVIVGTGSLETKLRKMAGPNVTFLGTVRDEQLGGIYAEAQGLLMLQEEDFGYTALEALFFQCPVLSFRQSGAAEIIEDGKTGMLIPDRAPDTVSAAIERFANVPYNVSTRREAILRRFSPGVFRAHIMNALAINSTL